MDKRKLAQLPSSPGVYLFLNQKSEVIYVGKAKHLRKRVRSYFRTGNDEKTQELVTQIVDVQTIATRTEVEALLLENRLIKQHKPNYNILLKESNRYAWIRVTDEDYPRILTARNTRGKGKYFGPYTDANARRQIVETLNKTFRLRTCRRMPKNVCLQYHIKNCSGPCEGYESKAAYNQKIVQAIKVLQGKTEDVVQELREKMQEASQKQGYELAKHYRDSIQALQELKRRQVVDRLTAHDQDIIGVASDDEETLIAVLFVKKGIIRSKKEYRLENHDFVMESFITALYRERLPPKEIILGKLDEDHLPTLETYFSELAGSKVRIHQPKRGDKRRLLELAEKNARIALNQENPALLQLQKHLRLASPPETIDCFDVSTLQGKQTVAACIRYRNGQPDPSLYRRFKIRGAQQDDYAAMEEAVRRRYDEDEVPDIILIDGGKGQLQAAIKALRKVEKSTPIIALAKQEEQVYAPGRKEPLEISQTDAGLLLLRRIRDATHRFVIRYHRGRRAKGLTSSVLEEIPGIGPARRKELYHRFSTFERIKEASKEELQDLLGEKIGSQLHEKLH